MDKAKTILITGASGFIGKSLVEHFAKLGWNVVALQRKGGSSAYSNIQYVSYSLENEIDESVFKNADVFIHAAVMHYSKVNKNSDDINLKATKHILACCEKYSVKMIFLSTMSAHDTALSHYGKNKFAIEAIIPQDKHVVLSLGLVIGHGGLFGTIRKLIEKGNIIPMLGADKPIQTVWLNDVCKVIERVCEPNVRGKYYVAELTHHTLKDFYVEVAKAQNKKPIFISLPLFIIHWIASIAEFIGLNLPIGSESVLGLKRMRVFDTEKDLNRLGIRVSSMTDSIKQVLNTKS